MATAVTSTATPSASDEWSLTMGNLGALVWCSPPNPVRTLLQELFIEQPEESLRWLHQAVWNLQQQEFLEALDRNPRSPLSQVQVRALDLPSFQEEIAGELQAGASDLLGAPAGHMEELSYISERSEKSEAAGGESAGAADGGCEGNKVETKLPSPTEQGRMDLLVPKKKPRPRSAGSKPAQPTSPLTWTHTVGGTRPVEPHGPSPRTLNLADYSPRPSSYRRTASGEELGRSHPAYRRMGSREDQEKSFYEMAQESPLASLHMVPLPAGSTIRCSTDSTRSSIARSSICASRKSSVSSFMVGRTPSDSRVGRTPSDRPFLTPMAAANVQRIPSNKSKNSISPPSRDMSGHSGRSAGCLVEHDLSRQSRQKSSRPVSVVPCSRTDTSMMSMRNSFGMASTWVNGFMGAGGRFLQDDMTAAVGFDSTIDTNILGVYDHLSVAWRLLSPMSSLWILWEFIWLTCILHELWAVPFDLIFVPDHDLQDQFGPLPVVALVCFCIDIVFRCAESFFLSSSWLFADTWQHFAPHAKAWLVFDAALSLFDFYLLMSTSSTNWLRLVKLFRGLRLQRAWHELDMAIALKGHAISSHLLAHILQLNFVVILLSHIHGVIWAALHSPEWMPATLAEAHDQYLECLWSACLAITFGGEMPATTKGQKILGIIISLERTAIIGIVLFFFVKCAQDHYGMRSQENRIREFIAGYLGEIGAPPLAQLGVLGKIQESHRARSKQICFEFISGQQVAAQFRVMLADVCWRSKLMSLGLVCDLMNHHPGFARELTNSIECEFAPTFTVLYHYDETCHDAYYILSGVLEVLVQEDISEPQEPYTSGMWVSEKALVNHELRAGETLSSKTFVELMVVSGTDFRRLLRRFDLTGVCDDLIKANLWLGFCGRCGLFGDHFKSECPLLELNQQKQGLLRRWLPKRIKRQMQPSPLGKDLRVFLQTYRLEHLLQPLLDLGVRNLNDLTPDMVLKLAQDPAMKLEGEEVQIFKSKLDVFRKKHAQGATRILANTGSFENYYIFLSHYKEESGTEAALMHEGLQQLISQTPGSPGYDLASPVFLDTEDLTDLATLRQEVIRSHNLILLLTNGVLKRPWVLLEIVTAVANGVAVLPVEIQKGEGKFKYPNEDYYQLLMNGGALDQSALDLLKANDVSLEQLCKALRMVFNKIASPYSPQKSAAIRKAELRDILKRCETKRGRASFTTDLSKLNPMNPDPTKHVHSLSHSEILNSWMTSPRVSTIRSERMDHTRSLNRQVIPESEDGHRVEGVLSHSHSTRKGRTGSFGTPAGAEFSSLPSGK